VRRPIFPFPFFSPPFAACQVPEPDRKLRFLFYTKLSGSRTSPPSFSSPPPPAALQPQGASPFPPLSAMIRISRIPPSQLSASACAFHLSGNTMCRKFPSPPSPLRRKTLQKYSVVVRPPRTVFFPLEHWDQFPCLLFSIRLSGFAPQDCFFFSPTVKPWAFV